MPVLWFLTDANVPDSIGDFLAQRGNDLVRVRDVMASDAHDPVAAEAPIRGGRILVSWDRDFNHQRFLKARFIPLQRVAFCCPEPEGLGRIGPLIERLEFEAMRSTPEPPLLFKIARDKIMIRC